MPEAISPIALDQSIKLNGWSVTFGLQLHLLASL